MKPGRLYLPAGQGSAAGERKGQKLPEGHTVQVVRASVRATGSETKGVAKYPGGQQTPAPAGLNRPIGQRLHSSSEFDFFVEPLSQPDEL